MVKHDADGRVPKEAGSTVQRATPEAQPTANCAEHKGLVKKENYKTRNVAHTKHIPMILSPPC